ncbi:unnamed protein product [Closterium sp. Yama58-4]|nr:unnamed protein product [Closterium sp. Yama58-4]
MDVRQLDSPWRPQHLTAKFCCEGHQHCWQSQALLPKTAIRRATRGSDPKSDRAWGFCRGEIATNARCIIAVRTIRIKLRLSLRNQPSFDKFCSLENVLIDLDCSSISGSSALEMGDCAVSVARGGMKEESDIRGILTGAAETSVPTPDPAGEGWPLLQSGSYKRACQEVELADSRAIALQASHATRSTDAVEITIDGPESSISGTTYGKENSSSTGWGMGFIAGDSSTITTTGNTRAECDYNEVNSPLPPGPSQRDRVANQVRDGETKASLLSASFPGVDAPASSSSGLPVTIPPSTADVILDESSPSLRDIDRHPLSPSLCSAFTCMGGFARGNGTGVAGSSQERENPAEVERVESAGNPLFETETSLAGESSPGAGTAEGGRGLMRACGLIGGGAGSAQQGNSAPQGPRRRGGRRRRRADAAREAEDSAMEVESGEVEEEGPENRRPLSVVIHGPGASFFVGTELIAAGARARAEGARGNAGAQGDRGAPGESRRGTESAQVDGADSGEDNYSDDYGNSEGGVDAVVRWGRRRRQHLRWTRGLARGGAGTSAARGGGSSDSGDADSDYDERDLEDREGGWSPYDDRDGNEGYCMECRSSGNGERGAEAGEQERDRQHGCAHGSVKGDGEGDEQERGAESDSSAVSDSSGYSQSSAGESKASADNEGDGAEAALLDFQFAPLREASGQAEGDMWVEAVHVVLPPPPASARGGWEGVDVAGMEAIFDPRCVKWFQRVKRLFIALLLLGSIFYIVSFIGACHALPPALPNPLRLPDDGCTLFHGNHIRLQRISVAHLVFLTLVAQFPACVTQCTLSALLLFHAMRRSQRLRQGAALLTVEVAGVMANRGKSVEVVAVDAGAAGQGQAAAQGSTGGLDTNFDYVSHAMLTSSNIWVAMAYLVLYLSLDMIGFAGAMLENVSLLTLYIVVELIITFISALEALRPFLLFRLLVILLALRLRYCALKVEDAERRLFSRLMGRPMPPPNRRTWLARLGIFPGTLSAMFRHAPLSRFQLRGRPCIDITSTPLAAHTQAEPEQAAEAAEAAAEQRESDAALAAQLLLPPPFPLVPHLPVPRTPSSSLPPSRSVSLTHQQQSADADLPASPSAALPPATSFTLLSSPLPSLPSAST